MKWKNRSSAVEGRRERAKERQEVRDQLSDEEQLKLIEDRRGNSLRERARLSKKLENAK